MENLFTGTFFRVTKNIDLSGIREESVTQVQASRLQLEHDLLKVQQGWISTIHAFFMSSLGILAGMSVMHIILIGTILDPVKFLNMYAPFAMIFNLIFLILSNFCVIFGITIALILREKANEQARQLDKFRHTLRLQFTLTTVVCFLVFGAMIALYVTPKYAIAMQYK